MKTCKFVYYSTQRECLNPVWGNEYCKYHQWMVKGKSKQTKKPRHDSGEIILFRMLWNTLERKSFVSGIPIRFFSHWNFHHVLVKGAYPRFRLYSKNIVLLTEQEHRSIHEQAKSLLISGDPRWQKYYDLYEELKIEYNNPKPIQNQSK